jgi:protein-tyrosine kinase
MSIVEKAAEKLKGLRSDPQAQMRVDAASEATPQPAASAIERLQELPRNGAEPADAAAPWHVDLTVLERMGYLPANNDGGGRLRDELRRIKRPLLARALGRMANVPAHANRIVVTSAAPGEGKTFTAVNLAMSLAREPDFEVLLVDGDIPKYCMTRAFGLTGKPGLMDVLASDRMDPAEVIVRTDVPNLMVVPAGEAHPLTSELFGSRRMEDVLKAFGGGNRRRLMIFDSSPLLATSESQVLVSYMGQVVVVVAARRTRQQSLNAALQCMSDSQYVGLILNMSQLSASENHYDSGYGY